MYLYRYDPSIFTDDVPVTLCSQEIRIHIAVVFSSLPTLCLSLWARSECVSGSL